MMRLTRLEPRQLALELGVDLAAVKALAEPVTLAQVKADAKLNDMALVKQSRLSVMPVTAANSRNFCALSCSQPSGIEPNIRAGSLS